MTDVPTRQEVQGDIDEAEKWGIGPALQKRLIAVARVALPHLPTQCDHCEGSGEFADVYDEEGNFDVVKCPKCGGTGQQLGGNHASNLAGQTERVVVGRSMTDTLTVRDHNRPCEHGSDQNCELYRSDALPESKIWCPGGREIVLRRVNKVFVEKAFAGVALNVESPVMWVEVAR